MSNSKLAFRLLTVVCSLIGASTFAARADGTCADPKKSGELSSVFPNVFANPFMIQATQADRLLERADACSRRATNESPRMIETLGVTKNRVAATSLEPFASEINTVIGQTGADSLAYAKVARLLAESRLVAAYERFAGKPLDSLPAACKGKLDSAFSHFGVGGSSSSKGSAEFAIKFQAAAQSLQALMGEQHYYRELTAQRKAAKEGRGIGCDVFVRGTAAQPYCPEDRLADIESSIESFYSTFPQLGMGRDMQKPAYEQGPQIGLIVTMNPSQLDAHLVTANQYVAKKISAAMNKVCAEPAFGGFTDAQVMAMPGVRNAEMWKEHLPMFERFRTCVSGELQSERELLANNESKLALGCAAFDFVSLGLASPMCAGEAAYRHMSEAAKSLTWLSKCRAGGASLCTGSEANLAQHQHEESRGALKQAGVDGAIAAATAIASAGLMKGITPKALPAKLPPGLAKRFSNGLQNLQDKPETLARLESIMKSLSKSEIAAIEEAHNLPNNDLAGKARVLREKAPRFKIEDRRALVEGWICGDKEGVTETIVWGKIDCPTCGNKGVSARPTSSGKVVCGPKGCGAPLDARKAYLGHGTHAITGEILGAEESIARAPEEIKMAKGGEDVTCPHCRVANKQVKAQCYNCGGPIGAKPAIAPPTTRITPPAPQKIQTQNSVPAIAIGTGAVAVAAGGALVYHHYIKPHDVSGKVTTARWKRVSHIERFTPVSKREWRYLIPSGSNRNPVAGAGESIGSERIRNCRSEFFENESYVCGSHQECRDVGYQVPDGQSCHQESYQVRDADDCRMVSETQAVTVSDGQSCTKSCSTTNNKNGSFTNNCRDVCTPKTRTEYRPVSRQKCSPRSHTAYREVCTPKTRTEYRKECKTVPTMCTRPIHKERCDYDTYAWITQSDSIREGNLTHPQPGFSLPGRRELSLDDLTRVSSFKDEFNVEVEFIAPDGSSQHKTLPIGSASEFGEWGTSRVPILTVNRQGSIQSFK